MLNSFKTCLNYMNRFIKWKKRKPEKFSSLTSSFAAMEVSNQLKHVFKLMDINGDGKISPYEVSEMLLRFGNEKSNVDKEAEEIVREVDSNGDGYIDIDEFMRVVNFNSVDDHEDYLMDAFLVFDSDKNGKISAEELQRVLIGIGGRKCCSIQDCCRMIKGVDQNGDGFVDFDEFRSMMTQNTN